MGSAKLKSNGICQKISQFVPALVFAHKHNCQFQGWSDLGCLRFPFKYMMEFRDNRTMSNFGGYCIEACQKSRAQVLDGYAMSFGDDSRYIVDYDNLQVTA